MKTAAGSHIAFVVLGNALPVITGLWGGLNAGEILLLLYIEFFVGTLLNNRRVVLHRRLSRKRGHFAAFEESDGTLHAQGLSFPPATGVTVFLFVVYGFFVWAIFKLYGLSPSPDLWPYAALAAAIPLAEYLLQRPGLGRRPFAWIEKRGQDTGGRLVAFGAMIPAGGVGLMFGATPGVIAMALVKALIETGWQGLFQALRDRRAKLPGLEGDPNIQREWRAAVAEYGRLTEHAEQVLDESTFHRLMGEARGDYGHVAATRRRPGERATFASDAAARSPEEPATSRPRVSEAPTQVFHARVERQRGDPRVIELLKDGQGIGSVRTPAGIQRWTGTLDGREVALKVAAPWNRFTWRIEIAGRAAASAKQPRAFGLLRMPFSFGLQLSAGAFHWAREDRHSREWKLTDTQAEIVHGSLSVPDWGTDEERFEVPAALSAADALFLVWLREQAEQMGGRS